MKALTLKQPWANLVASGQKTIETRTWATNYRGPVIITSSANPKIEPYGCIVAIADIVDCRIMTKADEKAACCEIYPKAHSWVLANVRAVEPVTVRGSLGLFELNVDSTALKIIKSR